MAQVEVVILFQTDKTILLNILPLKFSQTFVKFEFDFIIFIYSDSVTLRHWFSTFYIHSTGKKIKLDYFFCSPTQKNWFTAWPQLLA